MHYFLTENLKTLFLETYLPDGFIAKKFENHNFKSLLALKQKNVDLAEQQLVLWHFEDQIRYCYLQLIRKLEEVRS